MRLTKKSLCPKCPIVKDCSHADNRTQCFEYNAAKKQEKKEQSVYMRDEVTVVSTIGEQKRILEMAFITGYRSGYKQAYYELDEMKKGRTPEKEPEAEGILGSL